jgi:hypothetical protein
MAAAGTKVEKIPAKGISLGDDFGEVAVKVNGVYVEIHADGSIIGPHKRDDRTPTPRRITRLASAVQHLSEERPRAPN